MVLCHYNKLLQDSKSNDDYHSNDNIEYFIYSFQKENLYFYGLICDKIKQKRSGMTKTIILHKSTSM